MTGFRVFLLSDWIGETAERVAKACISQYPEDAFSVLKRSKVGVVSDIDVALEKADPADTVVFYTVVEGELREHLQDSCERLGLRCVDILEPALEALHDLTGHRPTLKPGLGRELDRTYFERIEALDFAVRNDDGQDPEAFRKADIVLIGVSRTTKTPLSIYLGTQGWKAANQPIVLGVEPPKELFAVSSRKMIGLTIEAEALQQIRQRRLGKIGVTGRSDYDDINHIYEELDYADAVMSRLGCRRVDVTGRAVEETAESITRLLKPGL